MQDILRQALKLALLSALVAGSALAPPRSQDPPSQEPAKTPPPAQQQTQQQTGDQAVERSSKLIDDPVVTEYVNRVGQNLVRNSDARVPFTIKVIDSDEINAF